jgi:hypothetical protein
MLECESCKRDHDGNFGSGRFCSMSCANTKRDLRGVPKTKQYEGLTDSEIAEKKRLRSEICRKAAFERSRIKQLERASRIATGDWVELSKSEQKERVLKEQNYTCAMCPIGMEWNGLPLSFDMDHIDGDTGNNSRDNLRCVCPNCHSQTPTYKSKNASGKRYTDEEVIVALQNNDSVYSALSSLGMNLHGGNYTRVRKLIKQYELKLPYLAL